MNDVSESEAKLQGTRIPAKRRVPTTGRTLGSAIHARELLLHLVLGLLKLSVCEV